MQSISRHDATALARRLQVGGDPIDRDTIERLWRKNAVETIMSNSPLNGEKDIPVSLNHLINIICQCRAEELRELFAKHNVVFAKKSCMDSPQCGCIRKKKLEQKSAVPQPASMVSTQGVPSLHDAV